jgi:hypothetical protein
LINPKISQQQVASAFRYYPTDWRVAYKISDELYGIKLAGEEFAWQKYYDAYEILDINKKL